MYNENMEKKIAEAIDAAGFHKHIVSYRHNYGAYVILDCKYCDHTAIIRDNPKPNEADISGSMVAIECPNKHLWMLNP